MFNREQYIESLHETVAIRGFEFRLRQPDIMTALINAEQADHGLRPGALTADMLRSEHRDKLSESDWSAIGMAVLIECCVAPKLVWQRTEISDDDSETLCVHDLGKRDLQRLTDVAFKLLGIDKQTARELAPFSESAAVGDAGADAALQTERTAE